MPEILKQYGLLYTAPFIRESVAHAPVKIGKNAIGTSVPNASATTALVFRVSTFSNTEYIATFHDTGYPVRAKCSTDSAQVKTLYTLARGVKI